MNEDITHRIMSEQVWHHVLRIRDFLQSNHIDIAEFPLIGIVADVEQFVELQFFRRFSAHIPCCDVYTEKIATKFI